MGLTNSRWVFVLWSFKKNKSTAKASKSIQMQLRNSTIFTVGLWDHMTVWCKHQAQVRCGPRKKTTKLKTKAKIERLTSEAKTRAGLQQTSRCKDLSLWSLWKINVKQVRYSHVEEKGVLHYLCIILTKLLHLKLWSKHFILLCRWGNSHTITCQNKVSCFLLIGHKFIHSMLQKTF